MTTLIDGPSVRPSLKDRRGRNPAADEVLDKPLIAELSNTAIEQMTSDELRHVIAASEHPWTGRRLERRLAYCDRETLLRLAYLARRCCRNQGY